MAALDVATVFEATGIYWRFLSSVPGLPRAQFKYKGIQAVGSFFVNLPCSLRALKKANEASQLSDCSSSSSTDLGRDSLHCCALADGSGGGRERGERKEVWAKRSQQEEMIGADYLGNGSLLKFFWLLHMLAHAQPKKEKDNCMSNDWTMGLRLVSAALAIGNRCIKKI